MSGSASERRANKHNARHNSDHSRNHKTKNVEKKPPASKGFPWITGCFVLLVFISGALITYDIQIASSYEKSHTAQAVAVGLEYGSYAWSRSLSASARGYLWAEKNAPYYYTAVADFSKPYIELASDMWLVISNQAKDICGNAKDYAVEKWPIVYSTIDHYVPGFLNTVYEYSSSAWKATRDFSAYYYDVAITYLKTKVFVDNWAPEVLQVKTIEALNTTRLYAVDYYNRFYKQVDHYSKL